jgi:hypothetical protein
MIAICGLDCPKCSIYRATTDAALARKIPDGINRGTNKVSPDQIRCGGCRGPKSDHWSGDCKILACCADDHELGSCHKCGDSPCSKLTEWADRDQRYTEAQPRSDLPGPRPMSRRA